MSCYHPLRAVVKGIGDDGKKILQILPYKAISSDAFKPGVEWFEIPCGKCLGCRQAQSMEWSNRLMLESYYHKSVYFVTLTYNDDFIRPCFGYNPENAEAHIFGTLDKEHIQKFIKRIRFNSGSEDLRYYCAGEYGDRTLRPHYHLILFGLNLPFGDLIPCGISETGNQYYRSKFLEQNWSDPRTHESYGFVSCEPANYYTFKYVSAYVTKKLGKEPNYVYECRGQIPPFSLQSRNPAIGLRYYLDHPECVEEGFIYLSTVKEGLKIPVPKYFVKKYIEDYPDKAVKLIERRKQIASDRVEAEMASTDLERLDYLQVKEDEHRKRLRSRRKI